MAVLGSAVVIAIVNKERWLQTHIFTLGMYFILFHTVPHIQSFQPVAVYQGIFGYVVSSLAFGFMAAYTIVFMKRGGALVSHS